MQSGAMTLAGTRTEIYEGANTLAINADGSINVTISGSIPVSGTVSVDNFPASQAVTGPLTDAELRAVPVPISGTVSTGLAQGLTDTQLRATAVPVSMSALTQAVKLATSGNYTYVGKAAIGSLGASAVWQIQRIDQTSGLVIEWADGNSNFDNVWANYSILPYS